MGRDEEDTGKVPSLPFGIVLVTRRQGPEEPSLYRELAVYPWTEDFISLGLSFPISKWTKS